MVDGQAGGFADSSVYACVSDVLGAGVHEVLEQVLGAYGVAGLTVAAVYHDARDVTPHGASRLTLRRDGAHFLPAPDLFAGVRLSPPVQDDAAREPLRTLRTATADRGAALHGWTVFCHNATLGTAYPECGTQSCFGDRAAPADLCPANPDVREYAVALGRNVARHGVDTVVAESLHYGTFTHGYHHERSFVPLGALDRFLFGLCFCEHCVARAADADVDADAARDECAQAVARVLNGGSPGPDDVTLEALADRAGPHTVTYVRARQATVTSLAAEVAAGVAEEGSRLVFLDMTGGTGDGGRTRQLPAAEDAWQLGIDPASVAGAVDGYAVLAYHADVEAVEAEMAAYRAMCTPDRSLRAVLRPGPPDTDSADHLAAKVAAVRSSVDAVDFYHYGLNTYADLDRIARAWPKD